MVLRPTLKENKQHMSSTIDILRPVGQLPAIHRPVFSHWLRCIIGHSGRPTTEARREVIVAIVVDVTHSDTLPTSLPLVKVRLYPLCLRCLYPFKGSPHPEAPQHQGSVRPRRLKSSALRVTKTEREFWPRCWLAPRPSQKCLLSLRATRRRSNWRRSVQVC
jgi:hypothetical protein